MARFKDNYFLNAVTRCLHHSNRPGDACRQRALVSNNVEHYTAIVEAVQSTQGRLKLCGRETWTGEERTEAKGE